MAKAVIILVLLAGIFGGIFAWRESLLDEGDRRGAARVHVAVEAAAKKQEAERLRKEGEAKKLNEEVIRDLEKKRADAVLVGERAAEQLRILTRARRDCPGGLPEASDRPVPSQGGRDESDERFAALFGRAVEECIGNNNRNGALLRQLRPQL